MKSSTGKDAKGGRCQGKQDRSTEARCPKVLPKCVNTGCRRETPTEIRWTEKIGSLRAWRLQEGERDRMWEVHNKKGTFKAGKPGV